ncbi:MAG: SDR family oxidoreductase, partial [Spirochaetales bacterium]|nr:SDR family oxidoreductase [Spirochaetales bacterium]
MIQIDLSGKSALVTGGASGIGKACALMLAGAGARVAVADINMSGAEQTAAGLEGGSAWHCDLADEQSIRTLVERLGSELGAVDILVNSAGIIAYRRGAAAVDTEEWDRVMAVNLRGAFLLSRELIAGMKSRGYGRLIHFSSLAARVGGIEAGIHYAASKAGLLGLVRTLAKEGAPHNVTANAVAPGIIATDPVKKQIGDHEER